MNIKRILFAGSSGFIGQRLQQTLLAGGYEVSRLVRLARTVNSEVPSWDPETYDLDLKDHPAFHAVINLAGDNLTNGLWTKEKKSAIWNSRINSTRKLCLELARLNDKPEVLLNASAIGFYGDRGDEPLDEAALRGQGFLAELCEAWEEATRPATDAGIRVVNLRLGIVLHLEGGALAKMLPVFRAGLGGILGDGRQYVSWITLEDVCSAMQFILNNQDLRGPVNLTSPNPVTNWEFTQALGETLNRMTIFRVPKIVLKLTLGEFAEETLLFSEKALPHKLTSAGYQFKHPLIRQGLLVALAELV